MTSQRAAPHDTPLGLLGYSPQAARALREVGLLAVSLPAENLVGVLEASQALRFCGALVAPALGAGVLALSRPDLSARRAGGADALSFAGGVQATHTLADALQDALESSGYPVRGARALLIGQAGDLSAGLALARLGLGSLTLAASSQPEAERLARDLPAGLKLHLTSRGDPALSTLAERADLLVLTAGSLPPGLLHPYHALLDLTGRSALAAGRAGASLVPLEELAGLRLARQLLHATGQRFRPEALGELMAVLDKGH